MGTQNKKTLILLIPFLAGLISCSNKKKICSVTFLDGPENVISLQQIEAGNSVNEIPEINKSELGYSFVWKEKETGSTVDFSKFIVEKDSYFILSKEEESFSLPSFIINSEVTKETFSKEEYSEATISIKNSEEMEGFLDVPAFIKGRGNSSWEYDKKPFKIKFEKKQNLFNFGKAKKYVLIANYSDKSLCRNEFAYKTSHLFSSLSNTTDCKQVDVFFNGVYEGVYLLCEQTEVGESRVDIDVSINPETIDDIGYLLELDDRMPIQEPGNIGYSWFYDSNYHSYNIKEPESDKEGYTADVCDSIKTSLNNCFNAVTSHNWSNIVKLVDVESFADSYLIHELSHSQDAFYTSLFFYKNSGKDEKLKSGPLWDFDTSCGNSKFQYVKNCSDANSLYTKYINAWYGNLLQVYQFQQLVRKEFAKLVSVFPSFFESLETEWYANKNSFDRNFVKWDIFSEEVWSNENPAIFDLHSWEEQFLFFKSWVFEHLNFLKTKY